MTQGKRSGESLTNTDSEKKQRTDAGPVQQPVVIRVSTGRPPALTPLQSQNGTYVLSVGRYFTIEAVVNGVAQLATWQVSAPHDLVKRYDPIVAQATVEQHAPQDLNATAFTGVWWRAGNKTITVQVQNQILTISFRVAAPTVDDQLAQMGGFQIGRPEAGRFKIPLNSPERNWLVLVAANGVNRQLHGVDINYDIINQQALPAGTTAFIQLVQTARQTQLRNGGQVELSQSNGYVLDNLQNPNTFLYHNIQQTLPQNLQISLNDGPGLETADTMERIEINDRFSTFLMFRPAGAVAETTWVPLDRLHWGWTGEARYQGNAWALVRGNPTPAQNPGSGFAANTNPTQAFPQWAGDVSSLGWQNQNAWQPRF